MDTGSFVADLITEVDASYGDFIALAAGTFDTEQESWSTLCAAQLIAHFEPDQYPHLLALMTAEVAAEPWTYQQAAEPTGDASVVEYADAALAEWMRLMRHAVELVYRQPIPAGLEPQVVRYNTVVAVLEEKPAPDDIALALAANLAWHHKQHTTLSSTTPG